MYIYNHFYYNKIDYIEKNVYKLTQCYAFLKTSDSLNWKSYTKLARFEVLRTCLWHFPAMEEHISLMTVFLF